MGLENSESIGGLRVQLIQAVRRGDPGFVRRILRRARERNENSSQTDPTVSHHHVVNEGEANEHNFEGCALPAGVTSVALHEAAHLGHVEVAQELINAGADVNSKNSSGNTPVHRASEMGHIQLLEVLMSNGAKLNIRNHEGKTPIAMACNAPTRRTISSEVEKRRLQERHHNTEQLRAAWGSISSSMPGAQPSSSSHQSFVRGTLKSVPRTPNRNPLVENQLPDAAPSPGAKMQSDLMDALTCVICLRKFCSEENSSPVTLPCGHNFCRECVLGLKANPTAGSSSFRCPMDRTVFSCKLELRVNTTLRELIRQLSTCRLKPLSSPDTTPLPALNRLKSSSDSPKHPPARPPTRDIATSPALTHTPPPPPLARTSVACSPVVWEDAILSQEEPSTQDVSPRNEEWLDGESRSALSGNIRMRRRSPSYGEIDNCRPSMMHGATWMIRSKSSPDFWPHACGKFLRPCGNSDRMMTVTTATEITSHVPGPGLDGRHDTCVHASGSQETVHGNNDIGNRYHRSRMQVVTSQWGEWDSVRIDRTSTCEGDHGGLLVEACHVSRRLDVDYDAPDAQRKV